MHIFTQPFHNELDATQKQYKEQYTWFEFRVFPLNWLSRLNIPVCPNIYSLLLRKGSYRFMPLPKGLELSETLRYWILISVFISEDESRYITRLFIICICMHSYMYIHVCMYACVYAYLCVYVYVCIVDVW